MERSMSNNDQNKKKKKEIKQRGSANELEIMKEIIEGHQGLYLRVLDVLRKNRSQESIFETTKRKQNIKRNTSD